jgi:phage I-like protein
MNTLILNRAGQLPADGWYEIETAGDHPNAAAGIVQRLDGPAFDAIVNRFKARAAHPNFGGLLIDQDHFSLDTSKSSEAFGWLKELRNRGGYLEGRIEWTDLGKAAVEGRRYKFFSTVYEPQPVEKLGTAQIGNRTLPIVRPLILDRLALTNDPNNKGGKPILNRADATIPTGATTAPDHDAEDAEARATWISNRARELRAADKTLSLTKSYDDAEAELGAATVE